MDSLRSLKPASVGPALRTRASFRCARS